MNAFSHRSNSMSVKGRVSAKISSGLNCAKYAGDANRRNLRRCSMRRYPVFLPPHNLKTESSLKTTGSRSKYCLKEGYGCKPLINSVTARLSTSCLVKGPAQSLLPVPPAPTLAQCSFVHSTCLSRNSGCATHTQFYYQVLVRDLCATYY